MSIGPRSREHTSGDRAGPGSGLPALGRGGGCTLPECGGGGQSGRSFDWLLGGGRGLLHSPCLQGPAVGAPDAADALATVGPGWRLAQATVGPVHALNLPPLDPFLNLAFDLTVEGQRHCVPCPNAPGEKENFVFLFKKQPGVVPP